MTFSSLKTQGFKKNNLNYYPFGMQMPGRVSNSSTYRFGFNGMEADDEMKGDGNSYDFEARMLDPRLGRWFSIDNQTKKHAGINPYHFVYNSPLMFMDPNGEDGIITVDPINHTVTLSSTVYLYGSVGSNPEAMAARYSAAFKELNVTRQVEDAKDPCIVWTVKMDVKFVYDESIANAKNNGENPEIPEGSNTLRLTDATNTRGETGQGMNNGFSDKSDHSVIHEVGHMIGFDDRYAGLPYEPYIGDFMSSLADGMKYGGLVGPPLNIMDFHFADLLDYSQMVLPDGGTQEMKTRIATKTQVVTPIYHDKVKVQIGEKVEFIEIGGSEFMIDNFKEKGVETKDKENAQRVEGGQ